MPVFPGESLRLSENSMLEMERALDTLIGEYENFHHDFLNDIDVWWEWYEATPQHKVKNEPWPGASNIVLPFIRTYADALQARHFSSMTSAKDFWYGSSRNESFRDQFLPHVVDFLNWASDDNEFSLFHPLHDSTQENAVIGRNVLAVNWVARSQQMFLPGQKNPVSIPISRGPVVEHIPSEFVMWDPGVPLQDSEVVIRQYNATHSMLLNRVATDGWDREAAEAALRAPGLATGPASQIQQAKLERSGYSPEGMNKLHDIREIWINWPFLRGRNIEIFNEQGEDASTVPVVITYHRNARKILRAIAKPYFMPGWPFYESYLRKRSGMGSSPGLAKILEHIQRAASTLMNQVIDGVHLANSVVGGTTNPRLLDQTFSPNKLLLFEQETDFIKIDYPKVVVPDIALINLLKTFAEALTGMSDPALGRETRMGGHPSPATNFVGQLQQGAILINASLKGLRHQWSRIGEGIATLYQQNESSTSGKITRALGARDAAAVREWLFPVDQPIPGNLELDIHALSETHSPEQKRRDAVLLFQVTGDYFAMVNTALNALAQPAVQANPMLQSSLIKNVDALGASLTQFLIGSDVDEVERYVVDVDELRRNPGAQGIDTIRRQLGEAAQGVQNVEGQPAVGTVPTNGSGLPTALG